MRLEVGDRGYTLDETAPQSAVDMLFSRATERQGLAALLGMTEEEAGLLPWPHYRDLVRAVVAAIYPLA